MAERTLVQLPVSPWSERARWALDHHKLSYELLDHAPFLGERKLRKLRKATTERATTPLLIEGDTLYKDSSDIARHADSIGSGSKLFPAGKDAEIQHWLDVAEASSTHGRALITRRLLDSPKALDEQLPPFTPGFVRPLLRPVTRYGTEWFARKYALDLSPAGVAAAEAGADKGFDAIRAGLQKSSPYLLGTFSWADIVACLLLQAVKPVQHPKYPLLPATRQQWLAPHLVEKHADLLAWRDDLYAKHR